MKNVFTGASVILLIILGINFSATARCSEMMAGIDITFVPKAYWDGATKSCIPRDHGFCLHISISSNIDNMQGTLAYTAASGITFTAKKSGIPSAVLDELFKGGYFVMDGDATLQEDLVQQLGLPKGFVIKAGRYPYTDIGGQITVTFKK